MIKAISGIPSQPAPGSSNRKLMAFARNDLEVQTEKPTYVPMSEADVEPRQAKVQGTDIDTRVPSEKCPWCWACNGGNYLAKHTDDCRRRFKRLFAESVTGRKRFEAAQERRLNVITKNESELQEAIETGWAGFPCGDRKSGSANL